MHHMQHGQEHWPARDLPNNSNIPHELITEIYTHIHQKRNVLHVLVTPSACYLTPAALKKDTAGW